MKLLSIIVPIYNAQEYLRQCVDSILNQTYKNFELLLVNDGSNDSSAELCDEYQNSDKRVRCIHKENGGCSSARNRGLDEACGEYIAFVDADDVLDLDFYEILVYNLENSQSDMSACSYINEYKSQINANRNPIKPEPIIYNSTEEILTSVTAKQNSIEGFVWNKVWKKSYLDDFYFRDDVAIVDDAVYTWGVISQRVHHAIYINLPMYHYRIISSSITRNSSLEKYYKALYGYEQMIEDAKDQNLDSCLSGLCTDYIIWNIKLCERMIFSNEIDEDAYILVKTNIYTYKTYIEHLGLRHKILARALLKSWKQYVVLAKATWYLKQVYFKIKSR